MGSKGWARPLVGPKGTPLGDLVGGSGGLGSGVGRTGGLGAGDPGIGLGVAFVLGVDQGAH